MKERSESPCCDPDEGPILLFEPTESTSCCRSWTVAKPESRRRVGYDKTTNAVTTAENSVA